MHLLRHLLFVFEEKSGNPALNPGMAQKISEQVAKPGRNRKALGAADKGIVRREEPGMKSASVECEMTIQICKA